MIIRSHGPRGRSALCPDGPALLLVLPDGLVFSPPEPVGGSITGATGVLRYCRNATTGETSTAPLGGATSWTCDVETRPGDLILQLSVGRAVR